MSDQPLSSLIRVDVAALSDPGQTRPNNEDQFFVSKLTRSMETVLTSLAPGDVPHRADEVGYVMVIADGMGGHAAGEVASRMAITALMALGLEIPDWIFKLDQQQLVEIQERARKTIQQVGQLLTRQGRQHAMLNGMGSTLTAARTIGRDLLIAHVGDSRAYLLRAHKLMRLTKDHTYAQLLVDIGQLEAAGASESRLSHVLTNVLGGSDEEVFVDIDVVELEDGDRLLLCSDGLTDVLDDAAIAAVLEEKFSSSDACASLITEALACGARDNVTVIVAAYAIPQAA